MPGISALSRLAAPKAPPAKPLAVAVAEADAKAVIKLRKAGIANVRRRNAPEAFTLLGGRCTILRGTLEEWLPKLGQASFDGEFADPPYELGFMGRHWDSSGIAFNPQTWRQVYRVLKPGALALNFGGSRTFHRMMVAIEDGGFYLADTFCWCYGSGFPKGLDIGKGLDKFFECERERGPRHNRACVSQSISASGYNLPDWQPQIGPAIHPKAKEWDGYNTALKPAWEPVPLFVKEPGATNYALQVLVHECGVLNIRDTRIGTEPVTVHGGGAKHYDGQKNCYPAGVVNMTRNGRHPANLVLSHHPLCQFLGYRDVKGLPTEYEEKGGPRPEDRVFGKGKTGLQSKYVGRSGFGDANGTERVPHWRCHGNCPVRMLDEQYGVTASKAARVFISGTRDEKANLFRRKAAGDVGPNNTYADEGGPSRYFLQTLPVRFLYVPKASRSERDAGLTGKKRAVGALQGSRDGTLNPAPEGLNDHECVKPIDLCVYYATLLLPPPRKNKPRRLLVPFSGSGSEMIGALLAGWDEVVGIEMSHDHVRKSIQRTEHWCGHLAK